MCNNSLMYIYNNSLKSNVNIKCLFIQNLLLTFYFNKINIYIYIYILNTQVITYIYIYILNTQVITYIYTLLSTLITLY